MPINEPLKVRISPKAVSTVGSITPDDRFACSSYGNFETKGRIEKILSPFVKYEDGYYDCRNGAFYEYVSEATGTSIDDLIAEYDRFVAEVKNSGIGIKSL